MVPFYLINRNKKRIELFFSLLSKEEQECLTDKKTIDIKAYMLEISAALTPKHFFNGTAKKEYRELINFYRYNKLFLINKKEKKHFVKRNLISNLFEFRNRNITIDEALQVVGSEGERFKDKQELGKNYSKEEIVLLLKTRLNKSYKPFTDNKKIFAHEFREFLECYKEQNSNIVDLSCDITIKFFQRYVYKSKKQSLQNKDLIKAIEELFTGEEKVFLKGRKNRGFIDDLLFLGDSIVPIYKTIEESKSVVSTILKIMRKDKEIIFVSQNTGYELFGYFLDALFYFKREN